MPTFAKDRCTTAHNIMPYYCKSFCTLLYCNCYFFLKYVLIHIECRSSPLKLEQQSDVKSTRNEIPYIMFFLQSTLLLENITLLILLLRHKPNKKVRAHVINKRFMRARPKLYYE